MRFSEAHWMKLKTDRGARLAALIQRGPADSGKYDRYVLASGATLFLQAIYRGWWRMMWWLIRERITSQSQGLYHCMRVRCEYYWLRLRGWDKEMIRMKWQFELDADCEGYDEEIAE